MVKKQFFPAKCKVTFRLPGKKINAESVALLGDFNNWDPKATPMEALKSGEFKAVIDLENNTTYQFRYLINQKDWYNDPEADDYVINEYGGHNCVVDTTVKE